MQALRLSCAIRARRTARHHRPQLELLQLPGGFGDFGEHDVTRPFVGGEDGRAPFPSFEHADVFDRTIEQAGSEASPKRKALSAYRIGLFGVDTRSVLYRATARPRRSPKGCSADVIHFELPFNPLGVGNQTRDASHLPVSGGPHRKEAPANSNHGRRTRDPGVYGILTSLNGSSPKYLSRGSYTDRPRKKRRMAGLPLVG
jgi:hypothetical protein